MTETRETEMNVIPRRGPPPRVRSAHLLSCAGRAQSALLTAQLAVLDLRPKYFALLNRVAVSEGSSQQQLDHSLRLDPRALVSTIDDLERQGLVQRRRDPRSPPPRALPHASGTGQVRQARAAARETAAHLLGSLSDEQVAALNTLLEGVVAELDHSIGDGSRREASA